MAFYLKCKMCGGDIEIQEGAAVGKCKYCGSLMTLPKIDSDKKAGLFNNANEYRQNNEFDKAYDAYKAITEEEPEEAEAYWGMILSEYGIEYVEDPKTGKRIPTCHRVHNQFIQNSSNYKLAIKYAGAERRMMYEEESEKLDDLQKDILSVSSRELPYDVFISYKETDDVTGERTESSVLAQDIYNELTRAGIRTFFSRITLEEHLGENYEPYIYAALQSAKVMLVITTDRQELNSVWVKNEWMRYLHFMDEDKSKSVIPVYKNISPYELPTLLSAYQASDMSKLGAIQDLVHGVERILGQKEVTEKDKLLNKVIADQKQKMEEEQERHQKAIEKKAYWQKVKKKYMVPSIIAAVLVIAAAIIIPFWLYPEITVRRPAYEAGCAAMERGEYEEALQQFVVCGEDYRDTAELIRIIGFPKDGTTEMLEEAIPAYIEKVRSISLTDEHKKLMKTKAEELFTKLVIKNRRNEAEKYASELGDAFGDESDWTDLVEYSEITSERVNDKPKETLDKLSSMRERGAYEAEAHFSSGVAWYISEAEKDRSAYQSNNSVAHAERALLIYSEMGDNIPEAVTGKNEFIEQMGQDADSLASSKEYEKAASIYDLLGKYGLKDGKEKSLEMHYMQAEERYGVKDYAKAASLFKAISGYRDADERYKQSVYNNGMKLVEKKDYVKAVTAFELIPDYSDANKQKLLAMYNYCVEKKDNPTDDVYTYLDKLTAAGYSGIEALKEDIYTWKGDLTWRRTLSVGTMQSAGIELTLHGGRKGASTRVTFHITNHTVGENLTYTTDEAYKAEEKASVGYSNNNIGPEFFDHEVTIEAFSDDGQLIASGSGKLLGTG